jgi:hypothetical protein
VTRRAAGVLATLVLVGIATLPAEGLTKPIVDQTAVVFLLDGASFEELLSIPEVRGLAGEGGAALLSARTPLRGALSGAGDLPMNVYLLGEVPDGSGREASLGAAGDAISSVLAMIPKEQRALVIAATSSPSGAMRSRKDDLLGFVMAEGPVTTLVDAATGPPPAADQLSALTSPSTRRDGVVVSADVLPTIEFAFDANKEHGDRPIISFTTAPAPFELHERYLANRRMTVPLQAAAGIYFVAIGLFGILTLRSRTHGRVRSIAAWVAFSVIPFATALLLAGHLPSLSYATVVPFVVAATIAGTLAFVPVERARGPVTAAAAAGAAVLAMFVVESALGWTAALTPFLGGSQLDGGRFFGLPNAYVGLVMGAAVYAAAVVDRPVVGTALVVAAGLFAGLPWTGSNLGGSVTIFAAAGLWYGVRSTGRLGARAVVWTAGMVAAGTAVVLAAHRFLASSPTHITRFVEGESGGILDSFVHRLQVGFDLIARNPFALIPVVGVPLCLLAVLRPPPALRPTFERRPAWRDALLTILAASVVAYVVNDSGAAALGLGFGSGLAGILYVSLLDPPGMMA